MPDLYSIETKVDPRSWQSFCGGNTGDAPTGESCVEVAPIPGHPDTWALRDNKDIAQPSLKFSEAELTKFAKGWLAAHGG